MRGSDPDAAVYWMTRMLEAGEDPLFVLRRMVIFASEDVGNADPQALVVAVAALEAVRLVGLPEGMLPMTQAVTYLATRAEVEHACSRPTPPRARRWRERGALPVPLHLRNAPTPLMKQMGYGAGYKYPHDFEGHYVAEDYLPDGAQRRALLRAVRVRLRKAAPRAVARAARRGRLASRPRSALGPAAQQVDR